MNPPAPQIMPSNCMSLEPLEGRWMLAHTHASHLKHLHHVAHQHHVNHLAHQARVAKSAKHLAHLAHVARTTKPKDIVLTALQKNDWASIRQEVLRSLHRDLSAEGASPAESSRVTGVGG